MSAFITKMVMSKNFPHGKKVKRMTKALQIDWNKPYIILKWGTLKGWGNLTDEQTDTLQRYADLGSSMSAMAQRDTDEQKRLLCEAINLFEDGQVFLDWDGIAVTKETGVKYIMEYGNETD